MERGDSASCSIRTHTFQRIGNCCRGFSAAAGGIHTSAHTSAQWSTHEYCVLNREKSIGKAMFEFRRERERVSGRAH